MTSSSDSVFCEKCQQNTAHACNRSFCGIDHQVLPSVVFRRTKHQIESPALIQGIHKIVIQQLKPTTFHLVAGIIHYGSSPTSDQYCSFRISSDRQGIYTNDDDSFHTFLNPLFMCHFIVFSTCAKCNYLLLSRPRCLGGLGRLGRVGRVSRVGRVGRIGRWGR